MDTRDIAAPGTLIDRLYQDWRRHLADKQRYQATLRETDPASDDADLLITDVSIAAGKVEASCWALATVLHADRAGSYLRGEGTNWTFGAHLAHDYHQAVRTRARALRLIAEHQARQAA